MLLAVARLSLPVRQSFNPALSFLIVRKGIVRGGGIAQTVLSSETVTGFGKRAVGIAAASMPFAVLVLVVPI